MDYCEVIKKNVKDLYELVLNEFQSMFGFLKVKCKRVFMVYQKEKRDIGKYIYIYLFLEKKYKNYNFKFNEMGYQQGVSGNGV